MMNILKKNRIEWIDYFKAIVICLVVIGHSTGKYNQYIYQFHMAAFFWVSGYCTNWSKCGKVQLLWQRFCTLILPLTFVFLAGMLGMSVLNAEGWYHIFFDESLSYIGVQRMLSEFFLHGNNYVWWMGATWFISVLFGIFLLHAIFINFFNIEKQDRNTKILYFIIICFFLGIGYYLVRLRKSLLFNIDLVFIGQFYFGVGMLCKNISRITKKEIYLNKNIRFGIGIIITLLIMKGIAMLGNVTVDYPARSFGNILINCLSAINGILLIYCFAKILEAVFSKSKRLKDIISFIGQNTVAIMFFHFLMFKLVYVFLLIVGKIDLKYMINFTPTADIGNIYWPLFLIVAVFSSIMLWKLLTSFRLGRILLGEEKAVYQCIYYKVTMLPLVKKISIFLRGVCNLVSIKIHKLIIYLRHIPIRAKVICVFSIGYIYTVLWPILNQKVILNDELQDRFNRMQGLEVIARRLFKRELSQGRPLRFMAAINETLSFLTNNMLLNKAIQCILILIAVLSLCFFLKQVLNDKKIVNLSAVLIILLLPVTFEHAVPNAFVGLVVIPFIWLCCSLGMWCKYLEDCNKKFQIMSLLFWIMALIGYEFIVTYTPLFIILYLLKRKSTYKSFRDFIIVCLPPCIFGGLYFLLTLVIPKIMPSNGYYEGVQIGFVSIRSSLDIIVQLISSALPSYFITNAKYQYLLYLYTGEVGRDIYNLFVQGNIQGILANSDYLSVIGRVLKENIVSFRNILLLIATPILLWGGGIFRL